MNLKQKLAYMALGAVIASFGYFIGTLNNLNAEDEVARVKKLIVSESITIGDPDNTKHGIELTPGHIWVGDYNPEGNVATITPKHIEILDRPPLEDLLPLIDIDTLDKSVDVLREKGITLSVENDVQLIEMRKPKGKQIAFQIGDKASIKLSNGGLKSKTIAVD